jgi:hypothetical protein
VEPGISVRNTVISLFSFTKTSAVEERFSPSWRNMTQGRSLFKI